MDNNIKEILEKALDAIGKEKLRNGMGDNLKYYLGLEKAQKILRKTFSEEKLIK